MSKKPSIGNNLHLRFPLQKRIILCLAEKGCQTINKAVKNMQSHYKPTWVAFGSLEKKGLIEKVKVLRYRNREYPEFWLTTKGVVVSIKNGVNLQKLKDQTEKLVEYDIELKQAKEGLALFFELIEAVGREHIDKIYRMFEIQQSGKFELAAIPIRLTPIKKKMLKIVRKYPVFANVLRKRMTECLGIIEAKDD